MEFGELVWTLPILVEEKCTHSKWRINERLNLNSCSLPVLVEDKRTHPKSVRDTDRTSGCHSLALSLIQVLPV